MCRSRSCSGIGLKALPPVAAFAGGGLALLAFVDAVSIAKVLPGKAPHPIEIEDNECKVSSKGNQSACVTAAIFKNTSAC